MLSMGACRRPGSVVVVFELVTHGQDGHGRCVLDLEQGDVPAAAERNQQLAQEGTRPGLAIDERRPAEPVWLVTPIDKPSSADEPQQLQRSDRSKATRPASQRTHIHASGLLRCDRKQELVVEALELDMHTLLGVLRLTHR